MISLSATWEAMKEERRPGCCAICDGPLPRTSSKKPRLRCGSVECARTFDRIHQADKRDREKVLAEALHRLLLLSQGHCPSGAWADAVAAGHAALSSTRSRRQSR